MCTCTCNLTEPDRMLDVPYLSTDGSSDFVKVKPTLVGSSCVRESSGNTFSVNLAVPGMVVLTDSIFGGINFTVTPANHIINKMLIKKKTFCKQECRVKIKQPCNKKILFRYFPFQNNPNVT